MKSLQTFVRKKIRKLSYSQGRKYTIRIIESKFIENLINDHVRNLKKKLEDNKKNQNNKININSIPFIIDDHTDRIIEYIFSKGKKNSKEIIFIQHYLTCFSHLVDAIFEKKLMTEPNFLLWQIAKFLKYESYSNDEIIFRYGDEGDKFYMIFTGKVAIIIPKEKKIKMTLSEYIKYLKKLMFLKEYGLIDKIINKNFDIFFNEEISEIKHNLLDVSQNQKLKLKKLENRRFSIRSNLNEKEKVKIEEYINRISPEINHDKKNENNEFIEKLEEIKNIIIYEYIIVTKLKAYSTFGDVALGGNFHKRTATIFSIDDNLTMGTLDIKTYKKCVKISQNLARNKNISCVRNLPFFQKITPEYFNEKFFNFFNLINCKRGDILFNVNNKRNKVYFIKEGEVELIMKGCVKDINNILDIFDKKDYQKRNYLLMKCKYEEDTTSHFYINDNFINVWKVLKVFKQDVFGLDDCTYNNVYFVYAKFSSEFGEIYEIDYEIFKRIVSHEFISNLFEQFQKKKIELMSERLKKIRNAYIQIKYRDKEEKYNINFNKNNSYGDNELIKENFTRNKAFSLRKIRLSNENIRTMEIIGNRNNKINNINNNIHYQNNKIISSYNNISHSRCLSSDSNNNNIFLTLNKPSSTFHTSQKSFDNPKNLKIKSVKNISYKIKINKPQKKKYFSKDKISSLIKQYIKNENILNNDILPHRFNEKFVINTNINTNIKNKEENIKDNNYSNHKFKLTLSGVNLGIPVYKIKRNSKFKKKHKNYSSRNINNNSFYKNENEDKKIFKTIITYK